MACSGVVGELRSDFAHLQDGVPRKQDIGESRIVELSLTVGPDEREVYSRIEHAPEVGVGRVEPVVVQQGPVESEDAAAEVDEDIARDGELAEHLGVGADVGLEALFGRDVGCGIEVRTDAAHPAAEVGTHAGDEAARPGVVLLVEVAAVGLEAVDAHIGLCRAGEAGGCPEFQVVGDFPAEREGRVEDIAVAGSVGVGSEEGEAQRGIETLVVAVTERAAVVDVAVLPVVELGAVAVEVGDMGLEEGAEFTLAEGAVPAEDGVTLHPALLARRPVALGAEVGGHVRRLGHAADVAGVGAGLGGVTDRPGVEGESFLEVEAGEDESEVFAELEVGLHHLGAGCGPAEADQRSDRVVGVGRRTRKVDDGVGRELVEDGIDVGRIAHHIGCKVVDAVVGTGPVFEPAAYVHADRQHLAELHVEVGPHAVLDHRHVVGAVGVAHVEEALLIGVIEHHIVFGKL